MQGRCQALVRSGGASATATGNCTLKPTFAGITSATNLPGPTCSITVAWSAGSSSCPLASSLTYNVYRGTVPDFVLVDDHSRNGVAVAARGVMTLQNGSRIMVGDKLLRVELPGAAGLPA